MRLFHSPASPFARKVRACAVAREIDGQITLIAVNAQASPPELLAANPLSKIPALLTPDGVAMFDSPVICEYLDSVGDALPMFPPSGKARWLALRFQAMGDGVMDAAVVRRGEQGRPPEDAREKNMARQAAAIGRTLDALEHEPPHAACDIGSISVACALGYLDFRFAHEDWRAARPVLAAWFAAIGAQPALAQTAPD